MIVLFVGVFLVMLVCSLSQPCESERLHGKNYTNPREREKYKIKM
jgi:hypothetical protein